MAIVKLWPLSNYGHCQIMETHLQSPPQQVLRENPMQFPAEVMINFSAFWIRNRSATCPLRVKFGPSGMSSTTAAYPAGADDLRPMAIVHCTLMSWLNRHFRFYILLHSKFGGTIYSSCAVKLVEFERFGKSDRKIVVSKVRCSRPTGDINRPRTFIRNRGNMR